VTRRTVLAGAGAAAAMAAAPAFAADENADFQQGRDVFTNGTAWAENLQAQDLFNKALLAEPNLASAKAYLAHSYIREWRHNWWSVSEADCLAKATQNAEAAMAMDDHNADAHLVMAIVHLVKGEFAEAEKEFAAAVALNGSPGSPDLLAEVGFGEIYLGDKAAGIAKLEQAIAANANHPWWYESALGWGYYQNHQYAEAVTTIKNLKKPVNDVNLILAAAYVRLKDLPSAQAAMAEFLKGETWTIADESGAFFKVDGDEQHWLEALSAAGMPAGAGKTPQPGP
jgi:adenylate cyclase